jgi:hypothetical protein
VWALSYAARVMDDEGTISLLREENASLRRAHAEAVAITDALYWKHRPETLMLIDQRDEARALREEDQRRYLAQICDLRREIDRLKERLEQ